MNIPRLVIVEMLRLDVALWVGAAVMLSFAAVGSFFGGGKGVIESDRDYF